MKFLLSLLFIFSGLSIRAQRNFDVLHYTYQISISDSSDKIYGVAIIYFKATAKTDILELDLKELYNGKGMKITDINTPRSLGISITATPVHLPYSHKNDKVKITLPHVLNTGDLDTIAIQYSGIPADGLIISKNKFGSRTFFADNWPNRAHHWIPCVDDPADKATVEFLITAPMHYQVISNGIQVEESNLPGNKKWTHYKEEVPLPTKVMVFGAADFAVQQVGYMGCVPVSSWVYPENKEAGFADYEQARDILAWHNDYIGPYPYKKLANVQSKTRFGGMENAGAIFYAEDKITGRRQEEQLLSHEIVHQWFGNMATEKSFAHLWLSEGFATYLTHLYMEARYGTDSLNREMAADRVEVIDFVKYKKSPVVDSVSGYMQLLGANSYQKGSWVLHMLRRQLGDSVFKKSIRLYYSTYAGKNAETKDLQQIFEQVSGKDLAAFFNQWLFTPVNPQLKITWKYNAADKQIELTIVQLQKDFLFDLPIEIECVSPGKNSTIYTLPLSKRSETFTLPAPVQPVSIIADPHVSLLFEGSVAELK